MDHVAEKVTRVDCFVVGEALSFSPTECVLQVASPIWEMSYVTFELGFYWRKMPQAYHILYCKNLGNLFQKRYVTLFPMHVPRWKETMRLTKEDGKEGNSKAILFCPSMFMHLGSLTYGIKRLSIFSKFIPRCTYFLEFLNCVKLFLHGCLSSFHGILRRSKCIHRRSKHGIWWD